MPGCTTTRRREKQEQTCSRRRDGAGPILRAAHRGLAYPPGSRGLAVKGHALVRGPAGDARVPCASNAPGGTVHDRHDPRHCPRRAGGGGARRYGDNPECRDQRSPNGGQREWILSVPQRCGGRVRADDREARLLQVRAFRAYRLPQSGCRGGRPAPAGRIDGDHRSARRCSTDQQDDAGSGRPVRYDADRRAPGAGRHVPRRGRPRAFRAGCQCAGQRPATFRLRNELFLERHAAALEQFHDRRAGQQRAGEHRTAAADQQPGHHPGGPADHESVRRRVRPRRGIHRQRGDQERKQQLPGVGVLVPQRRSAEQPEQSGQGREVRVRSLP